MVKYQGSRKGTKYVAQEYSPRWDQALKFKHEDNENTVKIRVYVSNLVHKYLIYRWIHIRFVYWNCFFRIMLNGSDISK